MIFIPLLSLLFLSPTFASDNGKVVALFPKTTGQITTGCDASLSQPATTTLTFADATLVFDSNLTSAYRQEEYAVSALKNRQLDPALQKQKIGEISDQFRKQKRNYAFPWSEKNGHAYSLLSLTSGSLRIVNLGILGNFEMREIQHPLETQRALISGLSANGTHIGIQSIDNREFLVINLETQAIVYHERATDSQEGVVSATFDPEHPMVTILNGTALSAYRIEPEELTLQRRLHISSPSTLLTPNFPLPVIINTISESYYIPDTDSFLMTYHGAPPAILRPTTNGQYEVDTFDGVFKKTDVEPPNNHDQEAETGDDSREIIEIGKKIGLALREYPYRSTAYFGETSDLLIAARDAGALENYTATIELFSVKSRKKTRTLNLQKGLQYTEQPRAFALSPNERWLAVSLAGTGVRIFDLQSTSSYPTYTIDFDNIEGSLLSFESNCRVIAGSVNYGTVYAFDLPGCL